MINKARLSKIYRTEYYMHSYKNSVHVQYMHTTSSGSMVTLITEGMTKLMVTVVSVLLSPDVAGPMVGGSIISSTGITTGSPSSVVAFS